MEPFNGVRLPANLMRTYRMFDLLDQLFWLQKKRKTKTYVWSRVKLKPQYYLTRQSLTDGMHRLVSTNQDVRNFMEQTFKQVPELESRRLDDLRFYAELVSFVGDAERNGGRMPDLRFTTRLGKMRFHVFYDGVDTPLGKDHKHLIVSIDAEGVVVDYKLASRRRKG